METNAATTKEKAGAEVLSSSVSAIGQQRRRVMLLLHTAVEGVRAVFDLKLEFGCLDDANIRMFTAKVLL